MRSKIVGFPLIPQEKDSQALIELYGAIVHRAILDARSGKEEAKQWLQAEEPKIFEIACNRWPELRQ